MSCSKHLENNCIFLPSQCSRSSSHTASRLGQGQAFENLILLIGVLTECAAIRQCGFRPLLINVSQKEREEVGLCVRCLWVRVCVCVCFCLLCASSMIFFFFQVKTRKELFWLYLNESLQKTFNLLLSYQQSGLHDFTSNWLKMYAVLKFNVWETELHSFLCGQRLKWRDWVLYKRLVFPSVLWHLSRKAWVILLYPLGNVTLIDCKN